MKKILLILMLLLTSLSFAKKTVIFSGETKKGKIVQISKDEEKEGKTRDNFKMFRWGDFIY